MHGSVTDIISLARDLDDLLDAKDQRIEELE